MRAMTGFVLVMLAGCSGPAGDGDGSAMATAQIVGVWQKHDVSAPNDSVDISHEFRADGTVTTTFNLHTPCSGATPIPTTTTRTWRVSGSHIVITVMSPDSCGVYPIITCLSDTGIPCTDLQSETMSFAVSSTMLTLAESAHGRENGTYTHP